MKRISTARWIFFLLAVAGMGSPALALAFAAVFPNPATPWQVVGLSASVDMNNCTQDVEVLKTSRSGSDVVVEYEIVPKRDDRGCFLPTPAAFSAPLGTFAPGVYRVRTVGPGRSEPVDLAFVVEPAPAEPPFARLERVAGDRQIAPAAGSSLFVPGVPCRSSSPRTRPEWRAPVPNNTPISRRSSLACTARSSSA